MPDRRVSGGARLHRSVQPSLLVRFPQDGSLWLVLQQGIPRGDEEIPPDWRAMVLAHEDRCDVRSGPSPLPRHHFEGEGESFEWLLSSSQARALRLAGEELGAPAQAIGSRLVARSWPAAIRPFREHQSMQLWIPLHRRKT